MHSYFFNFQLHTRTRVNPFEKSGTGLLSYLHRTWSTQSYLSYIVNIAYLFYLVDEVISLPILVNAVLLFSEWFV